MIPVYLADHLWQSTAFAVASGLLALALRRNRARTRYWLWLIASVKFLLPFSILVAIGSHVTWPRARASEPRLSIIVEQFTQTFPEARTPSVFTPPAVQTSGGIGWPAILFAVWEAGFLVVACRWWLRWRSLRAAVRSGVPVALDADVPVVSSSLMLEPGVFGVFRPVLVLPQNITEHLTPAHLEAIIAHEMCHVRHRDNLAAMTHMLIEWIFWFHPLVWWLGARLVEERERACDEEVLRSGGNPEVYAESILKTCEFYLQSPLACVPGVTGGDLKERVVRIMTQRIGNQLHIGKKLMLAAAGVAAVGGPIAIGSWAQPRHVTTGVRFRTVRRLVLARQATRLTFDVASIKLSDPDQRGGLIRPLPGGESYLATGVPVKLIMKLMYKLTDSQISGGPSWFESERYDIRAKADHPCNIDQLHEMFQSLLADRFKLQFHKETRELSAYVLTVDKSGTKMKMNESPQDFEIPIQGTGFGKAIGKRVPMNYLTWFLAQNLRRPVIDKTGLEKNYDFTLEWAPEIPAGAIVNPGAPPPPAIDGPTIFTALREQLGLKLSSEKGPVEVFVIDHVERPSEN